MMNSACTTEPNRRDTADGSPCPAPAWRSTLVPRATRPKLRPEGGVMGNGRFNVAVSFDERRGYVGTHPELRSPVTALSLSGLRRRIEIGRASCRERV